ncbi:MAG: CPBP family intramembrane metalloprotease [Spirochaetes bacterium]|jgi:membrane protease YdiL (CAAX protease family)|nr:CPBP family intramembrane metalloprotease [Spirochaetota bacterium]
MHGSIYNVSRLCKEMLLLFAVFFLPGILFQHGGIRSDAFDAAGYHLAVIVTALPQTLLIVYILWIQPHEDLSRFGFRTVDFPDLLAALVATLGMFALLAGAGAAVLLLPETMQEAVRTGFRFRLTNAGVLPLALLSSLAIAYREEAFFRAYLLTRFEQLSLGPVASVLLAAAAFSLGHIYQGFGGALIAFILGVYLGWIYLKRRSVHVVAVAHGLYNFTVLAMGLFGFELS